MKLAVIGGGNWGTAVANHLAKVNSAFEVSMWVFEELVDGRKLTEIINTTHENTKYLRGIYLTSNLIAFSSMSEVIFNADIIFSVVPHQFLRSVLKQIQMTGKLKKTAIVVSLTKGLNVRPEGPELLSALIKRELCLDTEVVVVSGANVAREVANGDFVEATVACRDRATAQAVVALFKSPTFSLQISSDVATVEMLGALKNVVAMGAGFVDGMGKGCSSKAALLRQGIQEMKGFCQIYAKDSFQLETVLSSAGVAGNVT